MTRDPACNYGMRDSIKDESFENEHILYELQAAILWPCIAQHGLQARADIQLQVPPPPPPPQALREPFYSYNGTCNKQALHG